MEGPRRAVTGLTRVLWNQKWARVVDTGAVTVLWAHPNRLGPSRAQTPELQANTALMPLSLARGRLCSSVQPPGRREAAETNSRPRPCGLQGGWLGSRGDKRAQGSLYWHGSRARIRLMPWSRATGCPPPVQCYPSEAHSLGAQGSQATISSLGTLGPRKKPGQALPSLWGCCTQRGEVTHTSLRAPLGDALRPCSVWGSYVPTPFAQLQLRPALVVAENDLYKSAWGTQVYWEAPGSAGVNPHYRALASPSRCAPQPQPLRPGYRTLMGAAATGLCQHYKRFTVATTCLQPVTANSRPATW